MTQIVTIDPVTRIEGHAKITIHLDEAGRVVDAKFHVTEFRGFEKFCEGRPFWEMPELTSRICGICPVSHMLASAKAGDVLLGVRIPDAAQKLRRVIHWAQILQSHALSFFHLSAPDLILGMESDPARRNVMGLMQTHPEVVRNGIRLRHVGQEIIRVLGGKSVHPNFAVPGGVRSPLDPEALNPIQQMLPEAFDIVELTLDLLKERYDRLGEEIGRYGDFPSLFVGLVTPQGGLEHYDGLLRVMDEEGKILEDGVLPERYGDLFAEAVEPWSYLKFPYYKPRGVEAGQYRVGPLARLNVCDFAGTPRADRELRQFRRFGKAGKPVTGSFHYHYARLIEILFCLEKIAEMLGDADLTRLPVRSQAGVNQRVGIGAIEAPRGTLFHEYHVDENGLLQHVNLVVATGHNNLAMNRTIRQIALAYSNGTEITEGFLNRIEHGIRIYDPCLSCSTHIVGKAPIEIEVLGPPGRKP
ncbi:Ni/Fe hydrogenase subunit alpha [Desulforhabdus amnigena]|uniref:NADP oxidoreductase n=1 Tax=Desulforhabdus amnigena TaxID=40218 RepID=A0A9W6FW46_9BACT|nr:Ni/Fe hydrogenase subunit alpha [Desulforhabdus amnigena]NLJ28215.1 Ni/Fe hydrogenase subunit alpha [Deltaproteobacteria bacterium]GLI35928.1 NADP oxidoreductase [Desulforhabdus amnigena]